MHVLKSQLQTIGDAARQSGTQVSDPLAFLPDFHLGWTSSALWTLPLLTFVTYLGVQWWSAWYPGAEPGGGGYVAQRMFCAKDEKNSLGATLWFNIAHYALRPWPWIITGLVALAVYSPAGGIHPNPAFAQNPQQGYVMVLRDYLPPALRGIMVAAFLAAFMSTLATQLNWGTSYLVNDLYRRFLVKDGSEHRYVAESKLFTIILMLKGNERHYVAISKLFTILLVLVSGYVAGQLTSIGQGWQIVLNLGMGTGAVYILRWYWWRINAWSEIVAMIVAAAVTLALTLVTFTGNAVLVFAKTSLITAFCTTAAWLIATFLTPAEPEKTLLQFYRRVHPAVYGWRRIAQLAPELPEVRDMSANALSCLMGCVLIYSTLFGLGKIIFGEWVIGIVLLVVAALAGYFIFWDLSRRGWQSITGVSTAGAASIIRSAGEHAR